MPSLPELSKQVISNSPELEGNRVIIEKEILHFDILRCLQSRGYLGGLTFIGGTALRLCHGSTRYSEDLDFDGGSDFSAENMAGIEDDLRSDLAKRYGHEIQVQPPKPRQLDADISVSTWRISVVTHPGRPDIPRQRIHLDIAGAPARQAESLPVRDHYHRLLPNRGALSIRVKTQESILADKLVAFSSSIQRPSPRWRDLWDINWLSAAGVQVNSALVTLRAADFEISEIAKWITEAGKRTPVLMNTPHFRTQLSRFLDNATATETVHNLDWRAEATKRIQSTFQSFRPVSTVELKREDQSNSQDDTPQPSKSKATASNRKTDNGNEPYDPF
ncbi:MAG: nucleotidyl transferase AbiEii/AbiGii toxin family protein [Rhodobacteraceae bacterium]|nr:nucleotidyl transferase AbiEii/AbiGii toxin family protein [Paracoccaceae bacterium]